MENRPKPLPVLKYRSRYPQALANSRRTDTETGAIILGGVVGSLLGVLVAYFTGALLGISTGFGALLGAVVVAHVTARRSP